MVGSGILDYTLCNNVLAETYKSHFTNLDFSTVMEIGEPISWKLSKSSPHLADKINEWLVDYKTSARYALLLDKYFNQQNKWAVTVNRYEVCNENRISAYDHLLKKYSKLINWDWRMLASLVYQESRFTPNIRSYRGAYGIMQMMPSTQQYFGVDSTSSVEQQIYAGVRYIKFLDNLFIKSIPDQQERIKFILASYNIGPGHIEDAQKIAQKLGKNPGKWFRNVDSCLLSKSDPKQYNDPIVQFGYCNGMETYRFVKEIFERYVHYKNVISE
jgi:membrane-bound lytic murein transglycosylase F